MPVHRTSDGMYQWGSSGKKYANKADAERQGRAAYANGYDGSPTGDDVRNYKPKSASATNQGGGSVGGGS